MFVSNKYSLGRERVLSFLDELEATTSEASSLYIPSGIPAGEIEKVIGKNLASESIPPDLAQTAAGSRTGAVVFWSPVRTLFVLPPFPMTTDYFSKGYIGEPLRALLKHDFKLALVLIRLGNYAIGVCQGEKLISSKIGTGLVHSRHRQGGSSSNRFRRHREKQIETYLIRVCDHLKEHLGPQAKSIEYIVYGGAQTTILLLKKQCPFLEQFDRCTLPSLLEIPDPDRAVLENSIKQIWSTRVIEWHNSEIPGEKTKGLY